MIGMAAEVGAEVGGTNVGDIDFVSFFQREHGRLARAALLLTGNVAEAEDLAQEALSRVLERWDHVMAMESPEGYPYRTALNLNRKRLRRLAVAARQLWDQPSEIDEVAAASQRLDVLRAQASLPRGQREAVVLVEWLGYGTDEAARIRGIEAASVRVRLHRAHNALRHELGGSTDD